MTTEDELKAARAEIERLKASAAMLREACVKGAEATEDRFTGVQVESPSKEVMLAIQRGLIACRDAAKETAADVAKWLAEHDAKVRSDECARIGKTARCLRDAKWLDLLGCGCDVPDPISTEQMQAALAEHDARMRAAALEEAADAGREAAEMSDDGCPLAIIGDRVAAAIQCLATPPPAASEPPCGGSRCWRAQDGTWVHSSKSYGTCRAAEVKP